MATSGGIVPRLRIKLGGVRLLGPGKADLLDAIARLGSISAAARELRMSYKRAWMLVDEMNRHFREPIVAASFGGAGGGGAHLTPLGREALDRYRHMVAALESDPGGDIAWLHEHAVAPYPEE